MKRRRGREFALQLLFQYEFTAKRPEREDLDGLMADDGDSEVRGFAEELLNGAIEHLPELDEAITKAAENWELQRMATVDRNILRCAVYELLFRKDIPSTVSINEAIEIAKKFSTTESASFINGILDKIAKGLKDKKAR